MEDYQPRATAQQREAALLAALEERDQALSEHSQAETEWEFANRRLGDEIVRYDGVHGIEIACRADEEELATLRLHVRRLRLTVAEESVQARQLRVSRSALKSSGI